MQSVSAVENKDTGGHEKIRTCEKRRIDANHQESLFRRTTDNSRQHTRISTFHERLYVWNSIDNGHGGSSEEDEHALLLLQVFVRW